MGDPVSEGVNSHLAEENRKLEQQVGLLQSAVDSQNNLLAMRSSTEQQILAYLPQLTHIATNLSLVASAVQSQNAGLAAIAQAIKGLKEGKP